MSGTCAWRLDCGRTLEFPVLHESIQCGRPSGHTQRHIAVCPYFKEIREWEDDAPAAIAPGFEGVELG